VGVPVAAAWKKTGAPHWPGVLPAVRVPGDSIEGGAFTVRLALVEAVSVADVAALTRKMAPPGAVELEDVRVRVEVRKGAPGVNDTGFGENDAVTPAGSPWGTVRSAVKAPALPLRLPRDTVTTNVADAGAPAQRSPDWAPAETDPTFGLSVKNAWAVSPT
jgi:hypothetical protein